MPTKTQVLATVIPDIHGHLARLEAGLAAAGNTPIIFLGDLIDDSPRRRSARKDTRLSTEPDEARAVLERVRALVAAGQAQVVLGNHEVMAIAGVLDGNEQLFNVWWNHGGRQTAAGYGWRGVGDAGPLADDLRWLREHGRLWLTAGPEGQPTLLAHATRPKPERVLAGLNTYANLLDPARDAVVWHPLGVDGATNLHPLPAGYTRSLHGHMETENITTLPDAEGKPAHQLDLHPKLKKLGAAQLLDDGGVKLVRKGVQ